jgi:hypothetical protein
MSIHNLITAESGNYFGKNSWSWRSFAGYGVMQNRENSNFGEYHGIMRFDVAAIAALNASNKAASIKFTMTKGAVGSHGSVNTGLGLAVGVGIYGSVVPSIPATEYNGQSLTKTDVSLNAGEGSVTTYTISGAQAEAWIDYLCAGSNKCFVFSRRLIDGSFSDYARLSNCTLEITWAPRGSMYFYGSGKWRKAQAYFYGSGKWRKAQAYFYGSGKWRKGV